MSVFPAEADPKKRARQITDAIAKTPDDGLPELVVSLVERLRDEDAFVRWQALDGLGRLAAFRNVELDGDAAEEIVRRSSDQHEYVRAETAVAIALLPERYWDQATRGILMRLLEDASASVRCEAAAALGDVKEKGAIERLASRLRDDKDELVRFECAWALASLGDDRGVDLLTAALPKSKKRLDACEALRRLGSAKAVPELEKLAGRIFMGWADRLTVWATLYACGARRPWAEKILSRTKARKREERTYALALIGTHRITEGAEVLVRVASDPKDQLRDTAVRALGDLGDVAAVPLLESVAAGSDEELREDARAALAKLKP